MTYFEIKETYKELFKAYPDAGDVFEKPVTMTKREYIKNGNKWQEVSAETKEADHIIYYNVVDPRVVRFFKGLGGFEKVTKAYTKRGFIPVKVESISPERTRKTVREFTF